MKIELRNIKNHRGLSQESNAYTADIWIDGVKRGNVSNHGTGGPDNVLPHSLYQELSELAKKLPPVKLYENMPDVQPDVDMVLFEALVLAEKSKKLTQLLKTKIISVHDGKCYKSQTRNAVRAGSVILNDLPFDKAALLFLQCH